MLPKDIGAYVAPKIGTVPANTDTTVNGTGIDRMGYTSCVLLAATGAVSGAPSAKTADFKIQDSADNSTFADLTGASLTQITADNTLGQKDVDLSGARRYIRVVQTVVLTAGTSPKWPVASFVLLGGADALPTT